MKEACAFLFIAVASNFAPELAAAVHGSVKAWHLVFSGLEAAALWAAVGALSTSLLVQCVAMWGVFEASQRPICRLAFPMDRPPSLPEGTNLCDAAIGFPMSWVSVLAALFLAALLQEHSRAIRRL